MENNQATTKDVYGLILSPVEPDQYILGAVDAQILQPSGDWTEYLPAIEYQSRSGVETLGCTVYGTLNCLEALMARLFWSPQDKEPFNYSERYLGVLANLTRQGGDPHVVAETIRKQGLIPDAMLPFDESIHTWEEFHSPNPMTPLYTNIGQNWLKTYDFYHEWVPTNPESLMKALKTSPLGVAVYAWQQDETTGYYVCPSWSAPSHWTVLYGYEKGKYWKIYDTYDDTHKKLAWDFAFGRAKVYHIYKKAEQETITQSILVKMKQILDYIQVQINELVKKKSKPMQTTNGKRLYDRARSLIGTRVIKLTALTQFGKLGCMASLNAVYKKEFGVEIGGGASTQNALPFLKDTSRFIEVPVEDSEAGDIWMYATGESTKYPQAHGHVMIKGNEWMMGNSSETGTWEATHTIEGCRSYFEDTMGFPLHCFRVL